MLSNSFNEKMLAADIFEVKKSDEVPNKKGENIVKKHSTHNNNNNGSGVV